MTVIFERIIKEAGVEASVDWRDPPTDILSPVLTLGRWALEPPGVPPDRVGQAPVPTSNRVPRVDVIPQQAAGY